MDDVRDSIHQEIQEALAGRAFESMEDAQAFLNAFQTERNQRPLEHFHGLSPSQVHRLLHHPLESPDVARVAEQLDAEPDAPLARLFALLAEAIGEKGLKPTAKGNFPRNACREIMRAWLGEARYEEYTRFGGINWEYDAEELHATRVVAEVAGLVRKYRGRFILSRSARAMLRNSGLRELYPHLFRTYVTEFNWAYRDGYPATPFVQQGWLFTAYLLHRHGDEERPAEFYADAFLQAFPAVEMEMEEEPLVLPLEQEWQSLYAVRSLERFAACTGLAVMRGDTGRLRAPFEARHFRAGPLLDVLVTFPGGR